MTYKFSGRCLITDTISCPKLFHFCRPPHKYVILEWTNSFVSLVTAMLWSTWLQYKNGPVRPVKYHILTEHIYEETISAVVVVLLFRWPIFHFIATFPLHNPTPLSINALFFPTSVSSDFLFLPKKLERTEYRISLLQLFDMKKFQSNVNRELRRSYPDRRRLETQCLSAVAFVKNEADLLECPIWVLIINVVAMDMLKSKLPPGKPETEHKELQFRRNGRRKQKYCSRAGQGRAAIDSRICLSIAPAPCHNSILYKAPDRIWLKAF
ncbi:hypothetical protein EVAR_45355_1 [Eumeta japonica]|uniref:MH2 domain-containing protein n=1 Tax=Eumeta variegata TaxID=151549 RepID=A0A4C1XWU3_EUMVA|nr:hypothetical protein EVAR_45355_1 [Eumeta japonica]